MSNGIRCCLTGVCCKRAKQVAAIVQAMQDELQCPADEATKYAEWITDHFNPETMFKAVLAELHKHEGE